MMTVKNPDDYGEIKGNKIRVAQADILQRMAKDICKQIQALAQRPETLATAAHAAWNCGRPKAVTDLADLMENAGGAEMMDVIRVGADKTSGAKKTAHVPTGATKDVAE
jgi:UDP-N-acetylglucosamine--N-acetylmuramyl-(pentapeptide) pyrophosphoryl-undecaprenol N-acetylglucosamine transferase